MRYVFVLSLLFEMFEMFEFFLVEGLFSRGDLFVSL